MVKKSGDVVRGSSSGFIPNKQGQVTIFIIIGIVILFAFAGIMYFMQTFTKESILTSADPVISDLPQAFQPISSYTEGCIEQIGERGLILLGEQGGYIYPDLMGKYSTDDTTNADGINLEPLKIPYWHYNINENTENTVTFSSLKPKLYYDEDKEMSIEAQLSRYVEENLEECLIDYSAFIDQGFEVEFLSDVKEVKTTIGDETVNFLLNMPLKLNLDGAEQDVEQFYVKAPIRLKHYYDVASEITNVQSEHRILERQTLNLISTYGAIDVNNLPPMDEVIFDFIPTVYWNEVDVKEKFKGMLVSHVPMLRYLGSENFYRYEYELDPTAAVDLAPLYQRSYDNTIIPLESGKQIDVNFDYFGWEPYFDLNDKGGRIEPSSYGVSYFKLQLNSHHYYSSYDVSYPVMVTITDENALMGEGYKFVFALESNVRNNDVANENEVQPPPIAALQGSMVCDEDKRDTEIIRSIVVDSYTKDPIEAVQVGFSIPEFDDCYLGETNDFGEFAEKYPAVYGGVGSYMKEDYLTNFYPIDTYEFQEQSGIIGYAAAGFNENVVEMNKYKNINITVKKKTLEKCVNKNCFSMGLFSDVTEEDIVFSESPKGIDSVHKWIFLDLAKDLEPTETATITLQRISNLNPNVFNDDFSAASSVVGSSSSEIELVPGIYSVNILIIDEEDYVIPKEKRCVGSGAFEECYDLDMVELDKYLSGNLLWDEEEYYLEITPEQLYSSQEIVFYVPVINFQGIPEKPHIRVVEDLKVMGSLGNYSQLFRTNLEPNYN